MISPQSVRQKLALAVISVLAVMGTLAVSPAFAKTAGIVPPHKPRRDCARASAWVRFSLANLNQCRAKEHVGRMRLPSNWRSLSVEQRMFVLLNLERVNRGLKPIVGLSSSLNALAQSGASAGNDPPFPSGGFTGGGGVWAGGMSSVIGADDTWMYYDGPHGLDLNAACTSPTAPGCWLHRQIILWGGTGGPLVAGAGFSTTGGYPSYAFEVLSGYSVSNLTFTWAHERHFFKHRPRVERLRRRANKRRHHRHHHKHHRHRPTITITV